MFDIGWSELVVIAVVALIAIGPKELPGVLRMVGQWMGKARKMAAEFQGQFQEAMREAEMADLKKSFDEVKEAASGFASGNIMTSLQKDVSNALRIGDIDKPAASAADTPAIDDRRDDADDAGAAADTGNLHLEAETHALRRRAAGDHAGSSSRAGAAGHRRSLRPQGTPKRHERRGYRGQQSAADGPPDRAALAADQGAAGVRHRLHLLLLLRQADLQRAGMAVRLGRGRRKTRNSSTRRCWNIS